MPCLKASVATGVAAAVLVSSASSTATHDTRRHTVAYDAYGQPRTDAAENTATVQAIPREHDISFGDFRRQYLATSRPAVVSGAMDGWEAGRISLAELDELCGDGPLFGACGDAKQSSVKYHASSATGASWGSLATLPRDDAPALHNLSALFAAQRDAAFRVEVPSADVPSALGGRALYLHDAALHYHCPRLLERLRAPRYFPVDHLRQSGPARVTSGCDPALGHPSLFVGAAASQSGLHRDSKGTRFWMAVLAGTKTFRATDAATSLALKARRPTACDARVAEFVRASGRVADPSVANELCPGYRFDLFSGGDDGGDGGAADGRGPRTDGPAVVWEANVSAGELIFLPEGWAHQVLNRDATIGVSYNWIDDDTAGAYGRLLAGLLDLYLAFPRAARERDEDGWSGLVVATMRRLEALGYAREHQGLPSFTLDAVAPDAPDATWRAFWANNAPSGPALDGAGYAAALQRWKDGGGLRRVLDQIRGEMAAMRDT